MTDLTIIVPAIDDDYVSAGLRRITSVLQGVTGEGPNGILGGNNGYGVEYENDTFMMHPFCWCDRSDCPWCLDCYCEIGEAPDFPVIEECGNCKSGRDFAPNFIYKPTGATVRWYKYIGRGMEIDGDFPEDFIVNCIKSVGELA